MVMQTVDSSKCCMRNRDANLMIDCVSTRFN